jgi:hypothetical protein
MARNAIAEVSPRTVEMAAMSPGSMQYWIPSVTLLHSSTYPLLPRRGKGCSGLLQDRSSYGEANDMNAMSETEANRSYLYGCPCLCLARDKHIRAFCRTATMAAKSTVTMSHRKWKPINPTIAESCAFRRQKSETFGLLQDSGICSKVDKMKCFLEIEACYPRLLRQYCVYPLGYRMSGLAAGQR